MANNLSNNSANTINGAANNAAASAAHLLDATKDASKQISSVAKDEINNLKADFEDLISRLPSLSESDLISAKNKIFEKLEATQASARGVVREVRQQLTHGVDATTGYVKDRPLQSVAAAAGVGILLGLLIARR